MEMDEKFNYRSAARISATLEMVKSVNGGLVLTFRAVHTTRVLRVSLNLEEAEFIADAIPTVMLSGVPQATDY